VPRPRSAPGRAGRRLPAQVLSRTQDRFGHPRVGLIETRKAIDAARHEPRGATKEGGGPGERTLIGQRIAVNAALSDRVHGRDYGTTSRPGACMTAAPSTGREAIMSLATGTRLNTYEILGPLGAGGMGEVYRARDVSRGATMPASPANSMGRGPSTLHV
jgi:hypothetical protein